jgi:hypothetical protein
MISRPFLAGAVGTLALFSITAASFGDDVTAKYPVPVKTMQEAGRLPIKPPHPICFANHQGGI